MRNDFFTIKHPAFAILHHIWGKMTFVVGQVDDTRVKTLRIVGYLPESFHVFRYLPDFCGIAYIMCTHSVYVAHICVLLRILFVCSIVFAPPLGQHIFMLRHLSCSCSVHRYAPLALPSFLRFDRGTWGKLTRLSINH